MFVQRMDSDYYSQHGLFICKNKYAVPVTEFTSGSVIDSSSSPEIKAFLVSTLPELHHLNGYISSVVQLEVIT